jgi:hypothetical protein
MRRGWSRGRPINRFKTIREFAKLLILDSEGTENDAVLDGGGREEGKAEDVK